MLLVFSLSVVLVHGVCCLASEAESRPVPHLHEHQLSRKYNLEVDKTTTYKSYHVTLDYEKN